METFCFQSTLVLDYKLLVEYAFFVFDASGITRKIVWDSFQGIWWVKKKDNLKSLTELNIRHILDIDQQIDKMIEEKT